MSYPRILITTYHQAFLVKGGGEHEMFSIADALKQNGLIADIYGPYSRSIENYDAIIHFSVHGGGLQFLNYVRSFNKPILLWPNVWLSENDKSSFEMIEKFIALSTKLLFKSISELENFCSFFPHAKCKSFLVNLGADSSYLKESSPDLFRQIQSVERYAIWLGIIEPNKNQLNAIKAMKGSGITLILVGNSRDDQYLDECKKVGGNDLVVIPSLPYRSELVRSALSGAEFYIEIGFEPPGLSAIEAGLCGCKLVLSDSSWSREHFGDNATYVHPEKIECIKKGIEKISLESNNRDLPNQLKKYCLPESISPLLQMLKEYA